MANDNYIEFKHVSKSFPGCKALDDVSFTIRKGEIHALLGENGAGKSTLLNILHGVFQPTEGEVFIDGEKVNFNLAYDAIKYGIVKVHQEVNMVADMTVAQNIMLGSEPKKHGLLDWKKMNRQAQELLDKVQADMKPTDKIRSLSVGQMQVLQIAKALFLDAKIVSFDEPTASLSSRETEILFNIMHEMQGKGITILYVSHRLDEVFKMTQRATVLRDGKYINTFNTQDMTKEELIRSMVGRDVSMFARRMKPRCVQSGNTVLEVKNLSVNNIFEKINFKLNKGEILGFYGLVGAKRTDVMRAIFGADKISGGEISINGKKVNNSSPAVAISNGVGLIPENRKTEGFIREFSNSDNIALPALDHFKTRGLQDFGKKKKNGIKYADMVNLKPRDPDFKTFDLSGGNQQKVVLAKWLSTQVDIMIFDEPTKGIDVGAKAEIYALMEQLVNEGKSIIMVSSELPEVIGLSDRMLVMNAGKIVAEIDSSDFDENRIVTYALGGEVHE